MWSVKAYDTKGNVRRAVFSHERDAREYLLGLSSRGYTDDNRGWKVRADGFEICLDYCGVFA